jgi:hypothetical protein
MNWNRTLLNLNYKGKKPSKFWKSVKNNMLDWLFLSSLSLSLSVLIFRSDLFPCVATSVSSFAWICNFNLSFVGDPTKRPSSQIMFQTDVLNSLTFIISLSVFIVVLYMSGLRFTFYGFNLSICPSVCVLLSSP